MSTPTQRLIPVKDLTLNKRFQMRVSGLNREAVDSYAEAMLNGAEFPPVTVFDSGIHLFCVDGFHRVEAHKVAQIEQINAVVLPGDEDDALAYARRFSNRKNGQRLTRADIKAIILEVIHEPGQANASDISIAEMVGVSSHVISRYRREFGLQPTEIVTTEGVTRNRIYSDYKGPTEYISSEPQINLNAPSDGGYGVLAERVGERTTQKAEELIAAVGRLNDDELSEWLKSPQREEVLRHARQLISDLA